MKKITLMFLIALCVVGIIGTTAYAGYASYAGGLSSNATIQGQNYTFCHYQSYTYSDRSLTSVVQSSGQPTTHQIRGKMYTKLGAFVEQTGYVSVSHGQWKTVKPNWYRSTGYKVTSQVLNTHSCTIGVSGKFYRR